MIMGLTGLIALISLFFIFFVVSSPETWNSLPAELRLSTLGHFTFWISLSLSVWSQSLVSAKN